ncbi:MAG: SAM-dependent methyltransferase [Albidovulum sp.]|nr:SAM-dependent methyltransferase [Albidovulum sp.]
MNINEVGATALIIAALRSQEDEVDQPLFSDPYSHWFVNEEFLEKARQLREIHPGIGDMVRFRTVMFNSILAKSIRDGIKQVVAIGSGLDMRPQIFKSDGVSFFEVDQPGVLDFKRSVLSQHGIDVPASVACNYLEVSLPERLAEVGFNRSESSLMIWEGNTMYLPKNLIFKFLNQICDGIEKFDLTFDYIPHGLLDGTYEHKEVIEYCDNVQKVVNAKFYSGFDDLREIEDNTALKVWASGNVLDIGKQYVDEGKQEAFRYLEDEPSAFISAYRFAHVKKA